jgi:hypothetical protein
VRLCLGMCVTSFTSGSLSDPLGVSDALGVKHFVAQSVDITVNQKAFWYNNISIGDVTDAIKLP